VPLITNFTTQTIIGVVDFERSIGDAIGAPRCHDQNTGETEVEKYYSEEFIEFLESTHHNITRMESTIAVVQVQDIDFN
jgi:gamma-glutamyltranspeptidase